jgi:hypothetical protein
MVACEVPVAEQECFGDLIDMSEDGVITLPVAAKSAYVELKRAGQWKKFKGAKITDFTEKHLDKRTSSFRIRVECADNDMLLQLRRKLHSLLPPLEVPAPTIAACNGCGEPESRKRWTSSSEEAPRVEDKPLNMEPVRTFVPRHGAAVIPTLPALPPISIPVKYKNVVGQIIGQNGAVIREIMRRSLCRVVVTESPICAGADVVIHGDEEDHMSCRGARVFFAERY